MCSEGATVSPQVVPDGQGLRGWNTLCCTSEYCDGQIKISLPLVEEPPAQHIQGMKAGHLDAAAFREPTHNQGK